MPLTQTQGKEVPVFFSVMPLERHHEKVDVIQPVPVTGLHSPNKNSQSLLSSSLASLVRNSLTFANVQEEVHNHILLF